MQSAKMGDSIRIVRIWAAMFDEEDSSGIIKWILQSGRPVSVAGSGGYEVSLDKLARRIEGAAARWLAERGEVLVPRELLLRLLDEAIRAETGADAYLIYDRSGKQLGRDEALDLMLRRTRLYPVADGLYFLAPLELRSHADVWLLSRALSEIGNAARSGSADRERVAKIYYDAFAEGGGGTEPLKWYHEKVAQTYGLR